MTITTKKNYHWNLRSSTDRNFLTVLYVYIFSLMIFMQGIFQLLIRTCIFIWLSFYDEKLQRELFFSLKIYGIIPMKKLVPVEVFRHKMITK